jgi:acetolactate synthase-1/2/3 large subunit
MEMEKLGIKRIMTHGEKAAAYMADGYARVSRRTGVCLAQSVGAVNLAAGLQDAYLACSPVIALTGRETQLHQHRHAYQEVDHVKPFAAVTKYDALVATMEQLPLYLRQAFREATSGTPGPVHLDLEGLAGQVIAEGEAELTVVIEETFAQMPPFRPEPPSSQVAEALQLLTKAKRPVIVAGGGVTASGAGAELLALAEKLAIPVATSLNAKAMFPADHPLAVGVPGLYSRACANQTLAEADLVFFIGSHTGGQVTYGYRLPLPGTTVIQLDLNPAELGRNFPIALGLQGDARNSLRKMIEQSEAVPRAPNGSAGCSIWFRPGKMRLRPKSTLMSCRCGRNDSAGN